MDNKLQQEKNKATGITTGKATPGVLCPDLGSPVKKQYKATGQSPVNGH